VEPSQLHTFQSQYSLILRSSFATFLKKRDKAKERRVDKLLKEKRKRMEETGKIKITAVGSSECALIENEHAFINAVPLADRGSGRRKRAQAKRKVMRIQKEKQKVKKATKASTLTAAA
jgi:signal recognition particle subunit SRP14